MLDVLLFDNRVFDTGGRRTGLTLPNSVATSYTYDTNDRLDVLSTVRDTTTLASFDYTVDDTGNRTDIAYADGSTSAYDFDDAYRLTKETRKDSGDNTIYEVSFEYDAVGNRTKMTSTNVAAYRADSTTAVLFHLDEPEDSEEVTDSSGHGLTGDVFGNVILGVEGRFSKAADFDGLSGSEIKVPDDPELEVGSGEFTLEAWIKPDEEALGTDIMAIVSKWCEVEGSVARSYLLRVNADGKLEGKVWGSGDETATIVSDEALSEALSDKEWVHVAMERTADDEFSLWVDRVKQEDTETFTATVADETEAFRIGAAGNVVEGEEADGMYFVGLIDEVRLSKTARGAAGKLCLVQVDYTYNARNQLVTETSGASTKTYSYDNNGNTTDIDEKVGAVTVAEEDMTYDALNRMTSYTGPEGEESFGYRGAEWHRFSADSTGFLYDGDNVLADITTGIDRLYVTPFLDQNLSMTGSSATHYYSQDGLGSVRTLTDSSGTVKNKYDYLPFGGAYAPGTSVTVSQRYIYTGREKNPASPLMYYRYRQYDPRMGRFGSRDPLRVGARGVPDAISLARQTNVYPYCDSSPVIRKDASGMFYTHDHNNMLAHAYRKYGICRGCFKHIGEAQWEIDFDKAGVAEKMGEEGILHMHFVTEMNNPTKEQRRDAKRKAEDFISRMKQRACAAAKAGECKLAMRLFGFAIHTFQDSWGHGTYIDGENLPISDEEHAGWRGDTLGDPENMDRYQRARPETTNLVWHFKIGCMGCCCDFSRAPGQKKGTKSLCK